MPANTPWLRTKEYNKEHVLPLLTNNSDKIKTNKSVYLSASLRRDTLEDFVESESENEDDIIRSEDLVNNLNKKLQALKKQPQIKSRKNVKIVKKEIKPSTYQKSQKISIKFVPKPFESEGFSYRLTYVIVDVLRKGSIYVRIFISKKLR